MGQTKKTEDPQTAIDIFLEREFPQLLKCQAEPHEAVLVPDSYIYKIAEKVLFLDKFFVTLFDTFLI
jgi:hypothetical protein